MMILAALVGLSLVANVSFDPHLTAPSVDTTPAAKLTPHQKDAIMRPLIRTATECVVREVAASPRFHKNDDPAEVNELIVVSMQSCAATMREMISAHDRLFGDGSGEAFFMGPFLDFLPGRVNKLVNESAD